ncbi:hypothetical protein EDD21DRAFT_369945 [Dissophora ornata]|nr:hypothetical protein EDD21DRAFT_369945 [Dissophora ornata]
MDRPSHSRPPSASPVASSKCLPSFLQSPSHARSNSASSTSDSNPSRSPSPLNATRKRSSLPSHHLHHTASSLVTSTTAAPEDVPMKAGRDHSSNNSYMSSASPVYQSKRISRRYSPSPASSYTAYSSALAASYHQHQQQQQQLQQQQQQQQQQHFSHTRSLSHTLPTHNTPTAFSNSTSCTSHVAKVTTIDHRRRGSVERHSNSSGRSSRSNSSSLSNVCNNNNAKVKSDIYGDCTCSSAAGAVSNDSRSSHRFNAPPSPCLSALDSTCRPSLISHDSSASSMACSALPSPSLSSVSSTDSLFSSASINCSSSSSSTSMAHCSPILPNTISALLLHDMPSSSSETSSMASSPILSYCSSPRMPSSSLPPSPSPSPPFTSASVPSSRTRRTSSTGSRTSQMSSTSHGSGYFSQHEAHLSSSSSSSSSSAVSRKTKKRSKMMMMGSHSSSPLSRPSSIHNASQHQGYKSTAAADANKTMMSSPQAVAQLSTRYIGFLLLPLIPLLFLALGAQTSSNFEMPAKYVV